MGSVIATTRSESDVKRLSSWTGASTYEFAGFTKGNCVGPFVSCGSMAGGASAVNPCPSVVSGSAEFEDIIPTSERGGESLSGPFPADVKGEPSLRQKFSASLKQV